MPIKKKTFRFNLFSKNKKNKKILNKDYKHIGKTIDYDNNFSSDSYLEFSNKIEKLLSENESHNRNQRVEENPDNPLFNLDMDPNIDVNINDMFPKSNFQINSTPMNNDSGKLFLEASLKTIDENEADIEKNDIEEPGDLKDDTVIFKGDENEEILMTGFMSKEQPKQEKDRSINENEKWVFTGITGFDDLLQKGIPAGSNIIVAGGPGCGKTIFCSQLFYNNALNGKDCVFLSMEERPDRLMNHMFEFGFKVKVIKDTDEEIILQADGKGKIALKRLQPLRLARSIEALLEKASGTLPVDIDLVLDYIPKGFNASLLALDSISAIETAFSGTQRQYRIYIEQLFRYFEEMNITTFMITESIDAPHKFSNTGVEEFLADGIFVFYNFQGVKKRTRGVEIYKLRGAAHSQRIVPMNITNKGMEIESEQCCKDQTTGN